MYYFQNNKGALIGGFHNRNSFLGTTPVKVYGAKIGLDYGRKVSFFLGYYTTYKVTDRYQYKEIKPNVFDTIVRTTNISYLSIGGDYVFHRYKRWDFDIPLMVGVGLGVRRTHINNRQQPIERLFILPIETGVRARYNIVSWLSIDASTGLRFSPFNFYEFTSSFYSFGLNIRVGTILKKIKSPNG